RGIHYATNTIPVYSYMDLKVAVIIFLLFTKMEQAKKQLFMAETFFRRRLIIRISKLNQQQACCTQSHSLSKGSYRPFKPVGWHHSGDTDKYKHVFSQCP